MKTLPVVLAFCLPVFSTVIAANDAPSPTEELSLNLGWQFHLGDIPFPVISGHGASYSNAKAGKAWGAAAPEFDDREWRTLDLPHDWAVEGPFDEKANISQGYRPRGIAWYRRTLRLEPSDHGRSLELKFDGISTHATVWVNGTLVHRNWCGYTGLSIDLTPFATFGDQLNVIAIRVDADAQEGWWYEGAGIYRHAWLIKRNLVHFDTDGIFANPVRNAEGQWVLPVEATMTNDSKTPSKVSVKTELLDPEGKPVGQATAFAEIAPLDTTVAKLAINVPNPQLWSIETPTLYTVRTSILEGDKTLDEKTTRCGFRTIRFDADKGFFLNDQPVKLKGTCNHQDHAGIGVAVPDSIWDFRIRRLKEMGSNAFRCAHNPPARELLDACDRLGMLVMDENRNFNVSPEYVRQLQWMVRRDRNHPSVILWSVFNEERMQGTEAGYEMVRRMSAAVKKLDTTRPVTAAMSGGVNSPVNVTQAVDVVGFNYQQNGYDGFHKAHPNQPMTSSEDTSAFMTRGVFEELRKQGSAVSYDTDRASWGNTHRNAWKLIAERPFVAGGFVWTGFDYRGEPQKFSWPSVSSIFGIMDTCGFPKTAYYIHQAAWIDDKPVVQIVPHWNWPGMEGKPVKVLVLTNGDAAELFLNGKSLGEKPVDRLEGGEWQVPFASGKLEAVAKNSGKVIARTSVETTGDPVAIKLVPDRKDLAGDGADAQPVTVSAIDAKGREVPTANLPVTFAISGPGSIIGHGNGDPTSHEPEKGPTRNLFNGLAQVIVQSQRDSAGTIVLTATAPGLKPAVIRLDVRKVAPIPVVPIIEPVFSLSKWSLSPVSKVKPDANLKPAETDMNSWDSINAGDLQPIPDGSWAVYRTEFTPIDSVAKSGGQIDFRQITGLAEIWLDGKLTTETKDPKGAGLKIALPPGSGKHTLAVLIQGVQKNKAGFGKPVVVTPSTHR